LKIVEFRSFEIDMFLQFELNFTTKAIKSNLNPFSSRELNRRKYISITRNYNKNIGEFYQGD